MPFPVYHDPDPKLKGVEGGNCNRTDCQSPNAVWFNNSTLAYYCRNCAIKIQQVENDAAFFQQRLPEVIFEGIFNPTDPRHQRC